MSTYREVKPSFTARENSFNALPLSIPEQKNLITSDGLFFVRNHQNIPNIDVENYHLTVTGMVKKELQLSLDDIQEEFPKVCISAILSDIKGKEKVCDDALWDTGSAAKFAGIRLRHVLLAAGVDSETRYVAFSGPDKEQLNEQGSAFSGLIPIRKAMSPEVLLAYEMNDEPLPIAQGFPLRVIVPSNDGAMSVKWITEIRLLAEANLEPVAKNIDEPLSIGGNLRARKSVENSLPEAPAVMAVICNPRDGETILDDLIIVEGYAMAIEGRPIQRVELSTDGGKSWSEARILKNDNPWAWCFWETYLKLHGGSHRILVRAWDDEGNSNGIQKTHPHSIRFKIVEDD
jgi:sulfite oxidase